MKNKVSIDSSDIDIIISDTDKKLLNSFLSSFYDNIKQKYGLEDKKLKISIESKDDEYIPGSIFSEKLGILETVVKYLIENRKKNTSEVAEILHRTRNNIAVTYLKSKRKLPSSFVKIDYKIKLPFSIFSSENTCFESICLYAKDVLKLSFHEIGAVLRRDERTIWTIYHRGEKR